MMPRREGRSLRSAAWVTIALFVLAGCGCGECCEEKLPNRGHADTPDDLVRIVQHEAKNECWSEMYDLLSARTRDKYSRLEWRLGVSSIRVPDYDYRVIDVAEKGTYIETLQNGPDEGLAYYDYQEPPKKKMKLRLLILREGNPPRWRIAMLDQNERIEHGDGRYWWFDR